MCFGKVKKGVGILLAGVFCLGVFCFMATSATAQSPEAASQAEGTAAAGDADGAGGEAAPRADEGDGPANDLAESPEAPAAITLSNLAVDGVPLAEDANSVNSDAKEISATIQIGNGTAQEWYYKTLTGQTNDIAELKFDNAFDLSVLKEISVDKEDPSKINFTIEVSEKPMTGDVGSIAVNPANNCFHEPLCVSLNVNLVSLNLTSITMDSTDKNNIQYTIEVAVNGGTLGKEPTAADLAFEGAFENAAVKAIRVSEGNDSFSVVVTKNAGAAEAGQTQGSLVLAAGCVNYPDATAYGYGMSVPLTDEYAVEIAGEESADSAIPADTGEIADKYTGYGKEMAQLLAEVGGDMLNEVRNCYGYGALQFLPLGFDVLSSILMDTSGLAKEDPVMERLDALSKNVDSLSAKLDDSTRDIMGQFEKSDFRDSVNAFTEQATNLKNGYYDSCNQDVQKALRILESGETVDPKTAKKIEVWMQMVYRTDMGPSKNYSYLYMTQFIGVAKKISGDGSIFKERNIFDTYHAMTTYTYNWNTQTFDARQSFNDSTLKFYAQGYVALRTAMQYDYELNRAKLETTQKWLEELKKEPGRYAAQIAGMEDTMDTCENNMDEAMKHIQMLDGLHKKIVGKEVAPGKYEGGQYNNAMDALNAEKESYDNNSGVIYNYRLRKNYDRQLNLYDAAYLALHFGNGANGERVSPGREYESLNTYASNRGNTLFNEVVDAKFFHGGQVNSTDTSQMQNCKGVWISSKITKTAGFPVLVTTSRYLDAAPRDSMTIEKDIVGSRTKRKFTKDEYYKNTDIYMVIRPA